MKLSITIIAVQVLAAYALPAAHLETASLTTRQDDYPPGGGRPCDRKRDPQRKGFTTPTCLKLKRDADVAMAAYSENFGPEIVARQENDYPIGGGKPCDRKRDPQRKGFTTPTCLKVKRDVNAALAAYEEAFDEMYVL